jgi:hypothetical protein
MQLFALQSKKEQLAEALKSRIVSGKVPTGTKLSSVRELADRFKVSTKIVIGALDFLEAERLIEREPGRGVFVRSCSANPNIEVCILSWNVNVSSDVYFNNLIRISHPPYLREGFNFTVRTVPFFAGATTSHFAQELQKLDKMYNTDCLLIHAPNLDSSKIKACLSLKTPVIFIGDFSHGLDPDIPFNQVTGDNTVIGENCVSKLTDGKNVQELVLYISSLKHYFCRKFYEGVVNIAKASRINIHLIETPKGFSSLDVQQKNKIFSKLLEDNRIRELSDVPAINGGLSNSFLQEQMKLGGFHQNIYYPESSENYIQKFYNTIFMEIKRIAETPEKTRRIVLKENLNDLEMKQI